MLFSGSSCAGLSSIGEWMDVRQSSKLTNGSQTKPLHRSHRMGVEIHTLLVRNLVGKQSKIKGKIGLTVIPGGWYGKPKNVLFNWMEWWAR